MKRLYNKYLAENKDGNDIIELAYSFAKEIHLECVKNDLDLRDACAIVKDTIHSVFATEILKQASKMRKEEARP